MHTSLSCSACGADHAIELLQNLCTSCGKPLLVGYDLERLAGSFTPEAVRGRRATLRLRLPPAAITLPVSPVDSEFLAAAMHVPAPVADGDEAAAGFDQSPGKQHLSTQRDR